MNKLRRIHKIIVEVLTQFGSAGLRETVLGEFNFRSFWYHKSKNWVGQEIVTV
jgi:hypothetical protein